MTFHTSSVSLYLTTLGTGSLSRVEKRLDEIVRETQSGKREPSILSTIDSDVEDADEQWNALKNELKGEGHIKTYLANLIRRRDLQETKSFDGVGRLSSAPISNSFNEVKGVCLYYYDEVAVLLFECQHHNQKDSKKFQKKKFLLRPI